MDWKLSTNLGMELGITLSETMGVDDMDVAQGSSFHVPHPSTV